MSEEHTFDDVVREHGPMIARIAASHEARPHLAEELVQDIWFAVWRALPAFRGDSSLRSFVARIAGNRAATHVAKAVRAPKSDEVDDALPAPGDDPETVAVAQDGHERLLAAVRALPLVSRQVVTLTLEGFGPGEIASALGITANAVSIRLSRAKDHLRNTMGDHQ
ncbi:MAG TPA: sigma-70 family RNA polymerase sigma factor [Croceibacterium sp.]